MNVFAKVSALFGLGMLFFVSPLQSAPLFDVASNGNYFTITTSSTTPVNAGIKSEGFTFSN